MNKMLNFFIRESFIVNLISVFICLIGGFSFMQMKRDIQPQINVHIIFVNAILPGASPEQIEQYLTYPIEEALEGISEIKKMTSASRQGSANIRLRLDVKPDEYLDVVDTVRARLLSIRSSLPPDTREVTANPLIVDRVNLYSLNILNFDNESESQRLWLESVKKELRKPKGVISVNSSLPERHLFVEVDPKKLKRYELTMSAVQQKINSFLSFAPVGSFYKKDFQVVVELANRMKTLEDLSQVPIKSNIDGDVIRLQDIADITYRSEKTATISRLAGQPFIDLTVYKDTESDAIQLSREIKAVIEELNKKAPDGLQIDIEYDTSKLIAQQMDVLSTNGVLGFVLVIIVLSIFLGIKPALMTSIGLPIAYLGTLMIVDWFGVRIDLISVIGMIIVVGILVDDAIIVTERYMDVLNSGATPYEAAQRAAQDLLIPVSGTIITTIVAFSPMLIINNEVGRVFRAIPLVIIFALVVSWIECFLILPNHLHHFIKKPSRHRRLPFGQKIISLYQWLLRYLLKFRYLVVIGSAVFFAGTIYLAKKHINFNMNLNIGTVAESILLVVKESESVEETERSIQKVQNFLIEKANAEKMTIATTIGSARFNGRTVNDPRYVSMRVRKDSDGTDTKTIKAELKDFINKQIEVYGTEEFERFEHITTQDENDEARENLFTVFIRGNDRINIDTLIADLEPELKKIEGYKTFYGDSAQTGQKWQFFSIPESLERYLLNQGELGRQISSYFQPQEIKEIRFRGETTKVYTEYPRDTSWDYEDLEDIEILSGRNTNIKLPALGTWKEVEAPTTIRHVEGERTYTIDVRYDPDLTDDTKFQAALQKAIEPIQAIYADYTITTKNSNEQAEDAKAWAIKVGITCVLLILLVLAIILRSLIQPLLVATSIPLAACAIIWALFLHGDDFTFLGIIGVIGVAGVAVNDAIILLYAMNQNLTLKDKYPDTMSAFIAAATTRFRPIWLTTLTTLCGVMPMAYGWGGRVGYTEPMAFSIGWGILGATLAALIVLPPCNYIIVDFKNLYSWLKQKIRRRVV